MQPLNGSIRVPGDGFFGISALLLGLIGGDVTEIRGFDTSSTSWSTARVLLDLSSGRTDAEEEDGLGRVQIENDGEGIIREAAGVISLNEDIDALYPLMGLLAGVRGKVNILSLEGALCRLSDLKRAGELLSEMGAVFMAPGDGSSPPLAIRGGDLGEIGKPLGADFRLKSMALFAALGVQGRSELKVGKSRNTTEKLFKHFGVELSQSDERIRISGTPTARRRTGDLPGCPRAASRLMAKALLAEKSDVVLEGHPLNPTTGEFVQLVMDKGADAQVEGAGEAFGEPVGPVRVRHSGGIAFEIDLKKQQGLAEYLPPLSALALAADSMSEIKGLKASAGWRAPMLAGFAAALDEACAGAVEFDGDTLLIEGGGLSGALPEAAPGNLLIGELTEILSD